MKNTLLLQLLLSGLFFLFFSGDKPKNDQYIVLAWNDLGMHCSNHDFSKIAVLPPYNNLMSQVIRKGSATTSPELVTSGFNVTYSIPGNTFSVGKTNFWDYDQALFGVDLPPNTGLTGNGLSGPMTFHTDHYMATGIPVTPFTDLNLVNEDAYQLALVELFDQGNNLISTTQNVIPVSNEINCVSSGCHSSEQDILNKHEQVPGFTPPVLCGSCHFTNALGIPANPEAPVFSFAIHNKHKDKTNDCYKCHPGPNTQCYRDVMHAGGMVCQDCHGSISQVASSIANGREPWLQEPSCGSVSCHGANYAEEPGKLFRQSKGHGGLYCSACHGSPHAILPSENPRDNVQNIALQGSAGTLKDCKVCHGIVPDGPGPHGYTPPAAEDKYVLVAWNDLGMHCANKDFSKIAVLPPYNNVYAQAIRKGNETRSPEIITSGVEVTYEIPGNTYSVGKTNFWNYENLLFGTQLPDNIGLTGKGLIGGMDVTGNAFRAEGIPITPYTDANLVTEDAYQLASLKLFDVTGKLLASAQPVVPVSNEINCVSSGCHSSENNILNMHSDDGGFDPNNTPILCASCHGSNALGLPGTPGLKSFSQAIHEKHAGKTNDCYKCHPGPNTQCYRDVMHAGGMVCQNCHGSVAQVAASIDNGRIPWLQEPSCGAAQCHGPSYAENPGKLFRQSKGHGGLFCSACHGSPHAILPSENERDNIQNVALQGFKGTLYNCAVCHGYIPSAPGPHGISGPAVMNQIMELPEGWSGISSYLIPLNQDLDYIIEPIFDDFVIMTDNSGVYWPDHSINTLNQWNASKGYIIKMNQPRLLSFEGIRENGKTLILGTGWNIMPVLSTCPVNAETLFAAYPGKLVIIKEVAGSKLYWPEMGINSLVNLTPGKSYFILTNTTINLTFQNCNIQ